MVTMKMRAAANRAIQRNLGELIFEAWEDVYHAAYEGAYLYLKKIGVSDIDAKQIADELANNEVKRQGWFDPI